MAVTAGADQPIERASAVRTRRLANAKQPPAGSMAEAQRNAIIAALDYSNFDKEAAAERLGIGRSTLYRLMRDFGISAKPKPKIKRTAPPSETAKAVRAVIWATDGYRWASS